MTINISELLEMGYHKGAPSADAQQIDGGICQESSCDNCGHKGMEYKPFIKEGSHTFEKKSSYRAFAECPECGASFEF